MLDDVPSVATALASVSPPERLVTEAAYINLASTAFSQHRIYLCVWTAQRKKFGGKKLGLVLYPLQQFAPKME